MASPEATTGSQRNSDDIASRSGSSVPANAAQPVPPGPAPPEVLRGRIGKQAVAAWPALGDEVAVKRDIIRLVADIKLLPAGKGSRRPFGRHRLEWKWNFWAENEEPHV